MIYTLCSPPKVMLKLYLTGGLTEYARARVLEYWELGTSFQNNRRYTNIYIFFYKRIEKKLKRKKKKIYPLCFVIIIVYQSRGGSRSI